MEVKYLYSVRFGWKETALHPSGQGSWAGLAGARGLGGGERVLCGQVLGQVVAQWQLLTNAAGL